MSKLLDAVERAMIPVPEWATKGYFDSDPVGLRALKARWQTPVTTPGERAAAKLQSSRAELVAECERTMHRCEECANVWLSKLGRCFWCRKNVPNQVETMLATETER